VIVIFKGASFFGDPWSVISPGKLLSVGTPRLGSRDFIEYGSVTSVGVLFSGGIITREVYRVVFWARGFPQSDTLRAILDFRHFGAGLLDSFREFVWPAKPEPGTPAKICHDFSWSPSFLETFSLFCFFDYPPVPTAFFLTIFFFFSFLPSCGAFFLEPLFRADFFRADRPRPGPPSPAAIEKKQGVFFPFSGRCGMLGRDQKMTFSDRAVNRQVPVASSPFPFGLIEGVLA